MRFAKPTRRINAATVLSTVALFIALGGTSYAAAKIDTNQLKSGAVTTSKIHAHAVTAKKIKRRAVRSVAIGNGQVTGRTLAKGAVTTTKLAPGAVPKIAYGNVVPGTTPTFAPGTMKNFTAVSHPATGTYCLTPRAGINPKKTVAVATADLAHSTGIASLIGLDVTVNTDAPDCAAHTYEIKTSATTTIAGGRIATDNIAFTIIAA